MRNVQTDRALAFEEEGLGRLDSDSLKAGQPALALIERPATRRALRRRGWLVRRMLVLADVVGITAAFILAELIVGRAGGPGNRIPGNVVVSMFDGHAQLVPVRNLWALNWHATWNIGLVPNPIPVMCQNLPSMRSAVMDRGCSGPARNTK